MGPSFPKRAEPTPPNASDPAIAAARNSALSAATSTYGRPQTNVTGGQGVTTSAQIMRKTLLGG